MTSAGSAVEHRGRVGALRRPARCSVSRIPSPTRRRLRDQPSGRPARPPLTGVPGDWASVRGRGLTASSSGLLCHRHEVFGRRMEASVGGLV